MGPLSKLMKQCHGGTMNPYHSQVPYVLISPSRNEQKTIQSMINQTLAPYQPIYSQVRLDRIDREAEASGSKLRDESEQFQCRLRKSRVLEL